MPRQSKHSDSGLVLTNDMVQKARRYVNNYTAFRHGTMDKHVDFAELQYHADKMCGILDEIARNQHLFNTER